MNREDIIRMAREAEVLSMYDSETGFCAEAALNFAALVASSEREACAKVCDELNLKIEQNPEDCAEAIRARGQV